jgi:hypothetical protein
MHHLVVEDGTICPKSILKEVYLTCHGITSQSGLDIVVETQAPAMDMGTRGFMCHSVAVAAL